MIPHAACLFKNNFVNLLAFFKSRSFSVLVVLVAEHHSEDTISFPLLMIM